MSTATPAQSNGAGTLVMSVEAENDRAAWELTNCEGIALSKSTWLPDHLQKIRDPEARLATCVGLVVMAKKWNMAPGMVAGETYDVKGKIGFQGKLYAALANAHGHLTAGLRAIYAGKGDGLTAVIFGSDHLLTDEEKAWLKDYVKTGNPDAATDLELANVKAIRIMVGQVKTDSFMWTKDPEQKLFYTGATKWCRKFMAELVLGAVSVEDLERVEYVDRLSALPPEPRTAQLDQRLAGMLEQAEPEDTGATDDKQASDPQDA